MKTKDFLGREMSNKAKKKFLKPAKCCRYCRHSARKGWADTGSSSCSLFGDMEVVDSYKCSRFELEGFYE